VECVVPSLKARGQGNTINGTPPLSPGVALSRRGVVMPPLRRFRTNPVRAAATTRIICDMIVAPTAVGPISDCDVSPDDRRLRMLKLIERTGAAPRQNQRRAELVRRTDTQRAARVKEMTVAAGSRLVESDEEVR